MLNNILKAALLTALLSAQVWAAGVVNINKANAEALQQHLNGVGPQKAQAIVDYRKKNGPFKSIDDLKKVPGIGDGIVKKNQSALSLNKGEVKASKAVKSAADKAKSSSKKVTQSKSAADKAKQSASKKVEKSSQKAQDKAKKSAEDASKKLKKDVKKSASTS